MESRAFPNRSNGVRTRWRPRAGKVVLATLLLLPVLFGMLAIVIDGNGMMGQAETMQHAADSAAEAAAMDLLRGSSVSAAQATATQFVTRYNALADATVTVNAPPQTGAYAGNPRFVEVLVEQPWPTFFAQALGRISGPRLSSRAVAGYEPTTAGAAIVVLDPSPQALTLPATVQGVPALPALPALLGGLEVLGLGNLQVQGAVLVNTTWGGVDQDGNPAGTASGPPYGAACTPLLSLTKLLATDIRVAGGVDNPANYGSVVEGNPSPLQANKLPVQDPWIDVPAPNIGCDSANVRGDYYGGVQVALLPVLERTLSPGVYDWIEIVSGRVTFSPGVYIVRGVNPLTGIALSVLGGEVTAEGTMFYITDTETYSPDQDSPDSSDGDNQPPAPQVSTLIPSAVINIGLPGSTFSAISSAGSPFNGMLLFQRRFDRRPVVLVQQQLLDGGSFTGGIYAKWGHVMLVGEGTFSATVTAGTMRVVELLSFTIAPTELLPAVQEVFLVE